MTCSNSYYEINQEMKLTCTTIHHNAKFSGIAKKATINEQKLTVTWDAWYKQPSLNFKNEKKNSDEI